MKSVLHPIGFLGISGLIIRDSIMMIPYRSSGVVRAKMQPPPRSILVSGRTGISKNAILSDSTGCCHPHTHSLRQSSATPHAASFVLNKPDDGVIFLPFVGFPWSGEGKGGGTSTNKSIITYMYNAGVSRLINFPRNYWYFIIYFPNVSQEFLEELAFFTWIFIIF